MARFAQGLPAHLWIAVLISLSYSCFTWFLRIYARVGYYGIDDVAITVAHLGLAVAADAADPLIAFVSQDLPFEANNHFQVPTYARTQWTVTALAQWVSLIVALNNGLGEPEEVVGPEHLASMSRVSLSIHSVKHKLLTQKQAVVASQIFFLLTMGLTSLSLTLLMRRIFSTNTKHKLGSYILLGVISAWLVIAVAAIKAECPSTHILEGQEHTCPNAVYRWRAILAIAICIEAAVMGLPIYLVSHLRIRISKKMLVVSAFAYRMPMIAFALLYLRVYSEAVRSEERIQHLSKVIVWQQVTICYSLLSATLPFVQAFMRSFTTGGTAFGSIIYGSRNSRSNSSGDTSRSRSRNESFTPQFLGRTRTVCRGAGKQISNEAHRASGGSQELIVRREVTVAVTQG
ncbi:hypothetical protein E4T48_06887 [Aureobasidium sp. EXF-10727]|nr:hypothetical protein E4T48_06887 [Aureobasidium sp. EXF-10727]